MIEPIGMVPCRAEVKKNRNRDGPGGGMPKTSGRR
jgi:hypothetical protein